MAGFVEVLGFDPIEQKTLAATFALSLRRERVYAKWRAGYSLAVSIVLVDGDNPEALAQVMARSHNPCVPLVVVSLRAPEQLNCIHVERPIRFERLLEALDSAMVVASDALHAATVPLPVQAAALLATVAPAQVRAPTAPRLPRSLEKTGPAVATSNVVSLVSSAERPALARVSDQTLSTDQNAQWVLVVDDNLAVRRFMSEKLAPFNINVDYAASGEQAVGLTGSKHYAGVFLDVVMPGMDGYQVCKLIKSKRHSRPTRVAMLTSRDGTFDKIRGKMSGCDAYLTKPVNEEKLMAVLTQFLGIGNLASAAPAERPSVVQKPGQLKSTPA